VIYLDLYIGKIFITADAILNGIINFSINFTLLVISATLFLTSLSLFYDTGIKRTGKLQVIKENIQSRWKTYVAAEFVVPVIISLLKMFFGY
jgi:hypothetical protein